MIDILVSCKNIIDKTAYNIYNIIK